MAARAEVSRAGARPVTATAAVHRAGLAWPRLPAAAELATIGAGYVAYALVRVAIHAGRDAAFGHAAQLWQAERRMQLTVEPWLNHVTTARPVFAEMTGTTAGLSTSWPPCCCWPGCMCAGPPRSAGYGRRWCWPRPR
jgi:hypothetical protein